MSTTPASVTHLIEELAELPGIGRKTAARLTFFLLRNQTSLAERLAEALRELKERTRFCSVCYNITEEDPCPICREANRDQSTICVVEEPLDVLALEQAGVYQGVYHVLHGVLAPSEGMFAEDLRIDELIKRVRQGSVREVILALNADVESEATASMIRDLLAGTQAALTRPAMGIPAGSGIGYSDGLTLSRAMAGRQPF